MTGLTDCPLNQLLDTILNDIKLHIKESIASLKTMQSFYITTRYNTALDITRSCCGSHIFIVCSFMENSFGLKRVNLKNLVL